MTFRIDCASTSGRAQFSDDVLTVADPVTTEVGCDEEAQQQDEWLRVFFAEDPEWSLEGGTLTLTAEDSSIVLEEADTEAATND